MSKNSDRLGVGIIGCGAVTQAIHLPTLSRLVDTFAITAVVDIDADVAREVGERAGARHGTSVEELWDDVDVDVIAVCGPPSSHASQVVSACRSGKRAVLCEKPLCVTVEEAHLIRDVSVGCGVPVLTGTMHLFDPAFTESYRAWGSDSAKLVRSVCLLPSNDRFVDLATQFSPSAPPSKALPEMRLLENEVLGLASHHLPLVRRFMPGSGRVRRAYPLQPLGYNVILEGDGCIAQMVGVMPTSPVPYWNLTVTSASQSLEIAFPPSYVQAGSASATLYGEPSRTWRYPTNGYVAEWEALAVATRQGDSGLNIQEAVKDFEWAVRIIEAAAPLGSQRTEK
jgi:predicted dehydrogenase